MTPADWKLIALALGGVGVLVLLVMRFRLNAFLALLIAAVLVGAGAGKSWLTVAEAFETGLGATLGGIAGVICLGVMLGKLLAESRGAEVLAKRLVAIFGPERVGLCIMTLALVVGLTTWFAVGLILLVPILQTLTRETRRPLVQLAIPLLACLSTMHGLMPPHPGPVVAIHALHARAGMVAVWALVLGLPTAAIAGPFFARWATRHVDVAPPEIVVRPARSPADAGRNFGLTVFTMLLPVLLMLLGTVASLTSAAGHSGRGHRRLHRQADDCIAPLRAVRDVVVGDAVWFQFCPIVEIHRGSRRVHRHGGIDRRWRRRFRPRPASQRRGVGHGFVRANDSSAAAGLWLGGFGVHPRLDRFRDSRHHHRGDVDGAGSGGASGRRMSS